MGALAAGYLWWFWRDQSRTGMRHYFKGIEYLIAHYPLQAEKEWLRGVREDPAEYHCYEQLGDYYTKLLRPEKAAEFYAAAARRAPGNGLLYLRLAAAEQKSGHPDPARAAARRAFELLPDDADAAGLYGLLLAGSRNRPAALAALRQAHRLRPGDRGYFIAMVNTEMDTLDFAGAERDLWPYLQAHSRDADACYMMAVIYNQKARSLQNLHAAIDFAQRAQAGMPADMRVYTLLGRLYLDSDRIQDALRVYTAGRRIAPNAEGMLRGLVDCYTRLGKTGAAASVSTTFQMVLERHDRISHLTHVMGFNHHNTTAGLELAKLVEEDGRYEQARAYYEQLARQAPQDLRTRQAFLDFCARMRRRRLMR
jgi:tetratricopeptide (TPR) repeat protein